MDTISPKRFGLAMGMTGIAFYMGCILLMLIVDRETFVHIANSLCHGLDVGSIIRMEIPWWESMLGMTGIFFLCGLFGYFAALLYNLLLKPLEQ